MKPSQIGKSVATRGTSVRYLRGAPWSIAEAKTHLAELLARVETEGPQMITRRGRPVAMVVRIDHEADAAGAADLIAFFQDSPLKEADLDLSRLPDQARDIQL